MRDRIVLPHDGDLLAVDENDDPVVFTVGPDVICMTCHPGTGPKMLRALAAEVQASEEDLKEEFAFVDAHFDQMSAALDAMMHGIVAATGWIVED